MVHRNIEYMTGKPSKYFYINIVNYGTWARLAFNRNDKDTFFKTLEKLKKLFGRDYDARFGLRAHSYRALCSAKENRLDNCIEELSLADSICDKNPWGLEYCNHFTIKSRIFLSLGMIEKALEFAQMAITALRETSPKTSFLIDAYNQMYKTLIACNLFLSEPKKRILKIRQRQKSINNSLKCIVSDSSNWIGFSNYLGSLFKISEKNDAEYLQKFIKSNPSEFGFHVHELLLSLDRCSERDSKESSFLRSINASTDTVRFNRELGAYIDNITQLDLSTFNSKNILHNSQNIFGLIFPNSTFSETFFDHSNENCCEIKPGLYEEESNGRFNAFIKISLDRYSIHLNIFQYAESLKFRLDKLESILVWQRVTEAKLREKINNSKLVEQQKTSAIAKTTQMLAHDVRKPFSILKIGLEQLKEVNDIANLKKVLNYFAPEVNRAIASVEGMISDVMEVGRTVPPVKEPVSIESVIEATFSELCRVYTDTDISITYDFNHRFMLHIDPLKVGRVFSNILGNAFQAMKFKGEIWIKTVEDGDMLKICLGNAGSFINEEDFPNLFDAFFTKNKKGGTGLGLAIAHKVVTNHGGKIWCESSREKNYVEFYFTLPMEHSLPNTTTSNLFQNTREIIEATSLTDYIQTEKNESASSSLDLEDCRMKIINYCRKLGRNLNVAVIDDEAVYRSSVKSLLERQDDLGKIIDSEFFASSEPLLNAFETKEFDILICDIDLGPNSLNGYEILKEVRQRGYKTAICVHSNRSLPEDYSKSIELGAQAFLTKPMTYFHFLKFLANAPCVKECSGIEEYSRSSSNRPIETRKDKIIFVDDEIFYRKIFEKSLSTDSIVELYEKPEDLIECLNKDPTLLQDVDGILLDNYYGERSRITGLKLGYILKEEFKYNLPVILISNGIYEPEELDGRVDIAIEKVPAKWQEIKALIPKKAQNEKAR
ncbi:MAG: hybrid sensor histidine kinase/response regulator [Oligoflexales bacterium]|nr:hybrid sensor histidine kinase/response regulator [Oligoflexales bacterium]